MTIGWGNLTLVFDQPSFQEGYQSGRELYFFDGAEADRRGEESRRLSTSTLLRVIAIPDERGRYQLDDGCDVSTFENGVEELVGVLVGYLSGPLHPETQGEREKREREEEALLSNREAKALV